MTDLTIQATIRDVFRSIPKEFVLRDSPKVKIEELAFREVLAPLEQYKKQKPKNT